MFTIYRDSSPQAAHSIYPASLSALGYGYPLWHPEPHITGEPQIGDVGYLREGAFIRLFNINADNEGHRVTRWPKPFKITETLPEEVWTLDQRHAPLGPGRFPSHGVEEVETGGKLTGGAPTGGSASLSASYSCKEVHGALLVLKSKAYAESLYSNRTLESYMIRQHDTWYTYAKDQIGHRVEQKDIVLVSGWVKAPADWAAAVFSSKTSSSSQLSLKGKLGQIFGVKLSRSHKKSYTGPPMERSGAKYPKKAANNASRDQCVFVKRYKMKTRLRIVRVITAGAGYGSLPGRDADSDEDAGAATSHSDAETLFCEAEHSDWDPLDILLEYILEVSGVTYAIARDEDIENILAGEAYPIDFSSYLRKRRPPVAVDNTRGRISHLDLLEREQVRLNRRYISSSDLSKWPHLSLEDSAERLYGRAELTLKPDVDSQRLSKVAFLQFGKTDASGTSHSQYTLSPDGSLLALTLEARAPEIAVWRTSDGLRLGSLRNGHSSTITTIAFSKTGRWLASGSRDNTIVIWDVVHCAPLQRLHGHGSVVTVVAFSPDNRLIVSASPDRSLRFWDRASGVQLHNYMWDTPIHKIVFHADGRQLAAVSNGRVALFDTGSRILHASSIEDVTEESPAVQFFPDGKRILVCAQGEFARVYYTNYGREISRMDMKGRRVIDAALSPDGRFVATVSVSRGDRDGQVILHDAYRGTEVLRPLIGVHASTVTFSPDGTFLAIGVSADGEVLVVNASSGEWVALFKGLASQPLKDVEFLTDSRRLAFSGDPGLVGIVNVADTLRIR
ncbi:WD40 repeat domain-containing protein [Phanerochaete sordida]|uniref:WD40 repeat domain-containing protein n=1 Tax=Phanerochaete sordida TaxID=48140 RepID=A0A9P3LGG3_9APHY|nr:WD40 repeat domain-containing protein [Phanerochaete sordida]